MERIQEMLGRLTELTAEEINDLEAAILSEFSSIEGEEPSSEIVAQLQSLAKAADSVRAELSARETAQVDLTNAAAEAATRIRGDVAGEASSDAPADDEVEAPVADETTPTADEEVAAAVPTPDEPEVVDDAEEEKEEPVMSTDTPDSTEAAAGAEGESTAEASVETVVEAEAAVEAPAEAEAAVEVPAEAEAAAATTDELAAEAPAEAELSNAEAVASTDDSASEASAQLDTNSEEPVTAAGTQPEDLDIQAPTDRRPTPKATAAVAITAGADIPGITAGSNLSNNMDVAEAFSKRLHTLRRVNGGDGEQHTVATFSTEYPADRQLGNDPNVNRDLIDKVTSPEAITASGGYCAPLEVRYEIFGMGVTDRPVRDALARFQADRGGIRYTTPPILSDYANAVAVWTAANDVSPSAPATKPFLTVACGAEVTATADAVTLGLQFGNLATRAYPELIAQHNELALIQHARKAEINLLNKVKAGGTAVTAAHVVSGARDFLITLDKAAAGYRYRHRLDPRNPLRVIAPAWFRDEVRADLALQMPGDGLDVLALADRQIDNFISTRNINITWSLEGSTGFGVQSAGAVNEFPSTVEWDIFAEGTFLFLDGGTLDIGIIRDSTLVGTNDYKTFVETFEGVAKVGIESLHVTQTVTLCGAAGALIDICDQAGS